jgi:hypothetical protein
VLDTVNLERLGVPAVVVVTTPFVTAARAVAAAQGLPDLRMVELPHDYLTEDTATVRRRATAIVDEVLEALFGTSAG